jgi:thiol:disulfide interchange protein
MRNFFNQVILLGILLLANSQTIEAQKKSKITNNPSINRVEVLDFHTDHRCVTCLEIEKQTRKVLADNYSKELKNGKITFRLINADDKANADIVKKFLAFGTTLIIYSNKDGKETHVDLTNFAFMNFNKADKFNARLKEEIDAALKNRQS